MASLITHYPIMKRQIGISKYKRVYKMTLIRVLNYAEEDREPTNTIISIHEL